MGWRDELTPATWRGVTLEIDRRELRGGRRIAHHLYPQRRDGYPEDLGRLPWDWSICGYLIGPDYLDRRDRLIAALDQDGPGEWVDLWGGQRVRLVVRDFSIAENVGLGGYCEVRIQAVEWSAPAQHAVTPDTTMLVTAAADGAMAPLFDWFAVAVPARLALDALNWAIGLAQVIRALIHQSKRRRWQPGDGWAAPAPDIADDAAALVALAAWPIRAASLAGDPAGFATALAALMVTSIEALPAGAGRVDGARRLAAGLPAAPTTQAAAVARLARGVALAEAARAVPDVATGALDDAVALRTGLAGELDTFGAAGPDPITRAMTTLRAATIRHLTATSADRARLTAHTPAATVPALVLAYRLYGDAGRETDILSRNPIRHPGAIPGGQTLLVPNV